MKCNIAVLEGDGIGPEVISEGMKVLNAIGEKYNHTFSYNKGLVGASAIDATGNPFPKDTLDLCLSSDAILFGTLGDPKYDNDPKAKVRPEQGLLQMRKSLSLFTNVRPVKSYPGMLDVSPLKNSVIQNTDFVIYRELTGGIYFGDKGRRDNEKTAYDESVYSINEIERIAKLAFEAAQKRNKKVTLVDKANVLETSRLWRETVSEFAKSYPDVTLDTMYVDNAAMQIIQNPSHFDVILTENMFGDILSDEASVITGSLGMLPSASVGEDNALYEPIHGSFPQAKNKGIANPIATILSAAMMLDTSFNLKDESNAIIEAVDQTIASGVATGDINKEAASSTQEVGDKIAEFILK